MDLNNNQILLLAVFGVALYFFMKYRQCSKQENFGKGGNVNWNPVCKEITENCKKSWRIGNITESTRRRACKKWVKKKCKCIRK